MKKTISLLVFCLLMSHSANADAECIQGNKGGQCVSFVRTEFGGSLETMSGLCQYHSSCGALHAWGNWDLGFGDGQIPYANSIMVLDAWGSNTAGHVAVVRSSSKNADGTYSLVVDESNWDADLEEMDCSVNYTFHPNDSEVTRNGGASRYPVLGFIYGQEPAILPTIDEDTDVQFCNYGLVNSCNTGDESSSYIVSCNEVQSTSSPSDPQSQSPVFLEGEDIILNAKFNDVWGENVYFVVAVTVNGQKLTNQCNNENGNDSNCLNHYAGPFEWFNDGGAHTAHVTPIVQGAQTVNGGNTTYRFHVCVTTDQSMTDDDCISNPDFSQAVVVTQNEIYTSHTTIPSSCADRGNLVCPQQSIDCSQPQGTVTTAGTTGTGGYPVCGSTNLEGDTYLCGESEGPCFDDHECQTGLICNELYECATDTSYSEETDQTDLPPPQERNTTGLNGDVRYCADFGPCPVGYGNCDDDSQCQEGLMCEADVGNNWNLSGWANVCVEFLGQTYSDLDVGGHSNLPNGHVDFCSADHPCTEGQGDCNDTTQCVDGLFCEGNAGSRFGMPGWVNVCVAELVGSEAELHGVTEELIASVTKYSEYMSATGRYLLLVPAGTFTKGASSYDQSVGADTEEKPAQPVEITFDFYIDKHEVTEGNWKVMFDGVSPSNNGDNHPVTGISIWDALEYANRVSEFHGLEDCYILNNCTGTPGDGLLCTSVDLTTPEPQDCQGYMLPTSAMWEYAARAGTETSFWAGNLSNSYSRMLDTNVPVEDISWFADNSGGSTHPVCTVTSTHPSGICDVHGNAAEWILGDYRDMPTTTPVTNPFALPTSGVCEYRGGHYESGQPYQLRSFRKGGGYCDANWLTWRYDHGYRGTGTRLSRVSVPDTSVPDVSVEEDEEPSEEEESIAEEVVQDSTPISNQCLDFSSIEGQASISHADQTGLDITGSMTIEMWYMPAEQPTWNTSSVLVRKNDSYTVSYYNEENTLYLRWFLWGEGETKYKSPYTLDNNTWYHLAWVYDAPAGTVGVYVDGEFIGQSSDQSHYIDVVASSFDISYNGPIWGVKGSIKEVRVWNTARSSEEIADNYQYQLVGDEPNLAGYWKLDGELTDTSANQNDLIWYSDHQAEYCAP